MVRRSAFAGAALLVAGAAPAEDLAEQAMRGLAALPSRSAGFVEEKQVASLAAPLASRGWLSFTRPDRLEKRTEAPRPERLVIEGDRVTIERDGEPVRGVGLDEDPGLQLLADTLRAVLAGDLPMLRRAYAIEGRGGLPGWRLLLVPHDAGLRARLARVTLDGAGDQLRQVAIQTTRETDILTLTPLP